MGLFFLSSSKIPSSQAAEKLAEGMKKNYTGNSMTRPEVIAKCIGKAVTINKPKTRYLLGFGAKPAVFIKNVFGDHIYDNFVKSFM